MIKSISSQIRELELLDFQVIYDVFFSRESGIDTDYEIIEINSYTDDSVVVRYWETDSRDDSDPSYLVVPSIHITGILFYHDSSEKDEDDIKQNTISKKEPVSVSDTIDYNRKSFWK